jgi:UDP-3-O-[3-hydroxymyristoyl] glucosamine N-acyltransferase
VETTLRALAELVRGEIEGDADLLIRAARPTTEAAAGDITFLESPRHVRLLENCRASAVVTPPGVPVGERAAIRVADSLGAFIAIFRRLHGRPELPVHGIDSRAAIHPSVTIGPGASILQFVSIGEGTVLGARCRLYPGVTIGRFCRLGDDVVLHPHVVLYDGTVLGNRVILNANVVIGADGFGYRQKDGRHVPVPQLGYVDVGDDVEMGACATVDRGTFGATRIGAGTKLDNHVQVAHNCQIGRHNLLAAQVGMAGSCSTGDYAILAGQVGVADHLHIGERAVCRAQAGVTKDVLPGQHVFGTPARPVTQVHRQLASLLHVPDLRQDVHRIKQKLGIGDS